MDRYHIVSQFKQRERVVIIDPAGTYYLSPLLQFLEAGDSHIQQAELATMAFLERNPKDFDNADLLKLMFLKPALAKAPAAKDFSPNHAMHKFAALALLTAESGMPLSKVTSRP